MVRSDHDLTSQEEVLTVSERISEPDLVIPALRIMADRPDGFVSTADLIIELEALFQPTGKDAEIIPERADTYFSQKVRNLISHRTLVRNGYATYDGGRRGSQITELGRNFLRRVGISSRNQV
jgi:hypothetical protein